MISSNVVKEIFGCFAFFYDSKDKQVLLHHRDNKTSVNPNMWGFFGGSRENQETPEQTMVRELQEELGIQISAPELKKLDEYYNENFSRYRYVYFIEKYIDPSELSLGEGQGFQWISLNQIFSYDLTTKTKKDLQTFINKYDIDLN